MASTGATKIMVIRHAEKPGTYGGQPYNGVNVTGSSCGSNGDKDLITLGWQRAGALVTLFARPWGPQKHLDTPQFLYASNPDGSSDPTDKKTKEPSQRPYETILPLSGALGLTINASFAKKDFKDMVKDAVTKPGAVLICWQHEDIPLEDESGGHGISHYILKETDTTQDLKVCKTWPKDANGVARYDLVFVFDRPGGTGAITNFRLCAQQLLAGDGTTAACT